MAFPRSRILSAKGLARMMKEAGENGTRFCFILGSGASVESGIPSGSTLEMRWMDCLMGVAEDRGTPPMDANETRKLAEALYTEEAIDHKFKEIEWAWEDAKKAGTPIPSEYYFDLYKLRFHANPHQGYNYLEKIMERCDPSLGYHTLAKLLTVNNLNNLVITTNFDSLVEDALFLYTDKKPLVVSHESLVGYMEANIQRPIIAKVHRGLMYAPFNSPETTQELKGEWQQALSYALNTYTPIVIGYAGGDHSLMSFLEDKATAMRNGIYWCYWSKADPAQLPEESIQRFVKKRNGYLVPMDGFDALMMEIGQTMFDDAIRPGLTEKLLKEKHDERVRRYNERWMKLNENPDMQKVLQDMNKTEEKEEKQREEEEKLTAWDYFRRGLRADEEGRYEDAIKAYLKALEREPENAATYNNMGVAYNNLNENERALEKYNRAIELTPEAMYYSNRGYTYMRLNRLDKAMADCEKAIELDPDYASAYDNRGDIYYLLQEYEKAIADFTKAIELNPKDKEFYLDRAKTYDAMGEKDLAEADRKTAEGL